MASQENKINLVFSRAFLFFFISSYVLRIIFSSVYFKQLGLSSSQTGLLQGASSIARAFGALTLGFLADRIDRRKTIFLIALFSSAATPALLSIPRLKEEKCLHKSPRSQLPQTLRKNQVFWGVSSHSLASSTRHSNHTSLSRTKILRILDGLNERVEKKHRPSNITLPTNYETKQRLRSNDSMEYLLVTLVLITIVGDFIGGPALNLSDTAIMANLEDSKDRYGTIRLWGDLGQMVLIPSVAITEHFLKITVCDIETSDYSISLPIMSTGMAIAFLIGFKVNIPSSTEQNSGTISDLETDKDESEETSTLMILKEFVAPLANWSLLVDAFFLGVFLSAIQTFLFWTMIDLDASQASLSVGISNFCRNITSMIAYYYSTILLQKFGIRNVINLSIATYLVTFVIAAFFRNPWLAIIPDCLVYMALAFSMTACVLHVSQTAPVGWSATTQGILQFTYSGVGQGVGPLMTGAIMDSLGQTHTYLLFAGLALLLLVFSLSVQSILVVRSRNNEYQSLTDRKEIKIDGP